MSGSELYFEVQDANPLVVILHSVGPAEPKPRILERILEKLNIGRGMAAFIGLIAEFPRHATILTMLTVIVGGHKVHKVTGITFDGKGCHSIYIQLE